MKALAGDDRNPAVAGFDPDVSAELYTTNGDITDDALTTYGTQAYTVELSGGEGPDVGGTTNSDDAFSPGGFVFQDDEAAVEAEFRKNLDFALDLAKSAGDPANPVSHLGNTAPDFVPTTFAISYGDPQTVEVNAKRELGDVRAYWRVNGGQTRSAKTGRVRRRGPLRRPRRLLPPAARAGPRSPQGRQGDGVVRRQGRAVAPVHLHGRARTARTRSC